jgi:hypothetical protein
MKFSKAIVSLVILLNAAFTIAVLFIFYRIGTEPAVLIGAWFGFTTVELWALAGIKKKEIEIGGKEIDDGEPHNDGC